MLVVISTLWRGSAVLLAALLQSGTVLYLGTSISGGDAVTYLGLSDYWLSTGDLLSPDAFEGNFWPAGYPGFLALFAWAGENQIIAIRMAQILLAAAIALMAGVLADQISRKAGTVTTVLVAFSPTSLWAVWAIGYELVLGFLLMTALVLAMRSATSGNRVSSTTAGLLFGLAILVQFRAVLAVLLIVVLVGAQSKRVGAYLSMGALVPVLLWSVRSFIALGTPAPWSANGPYNLWNGNNPVATGHNVFPLPDLPAGYTSYTSAALDWIVQNPADFAVLTAKKFLFLFEPTRISGISDPFPGEILVTGLEVVLAAFLVSGTVLFLSLRLISRERELQPLDAPFWFAVAYLLPNVVFIVEARFAIPVHAVLIAVSVGAFYVLHVKLSSRTQLLSRSAS